MTRFSFVFSFLISLVAPRYRAFNEPKSALSTTPTLPPSSLPLVVVPTAQSKLQHNQQSIQQLQLQLTSPSRCYEKKSKCVMRNGALSILDALADRLGSGATLSAQQQTKEQHQQQLQLQKEAQARCDTFFGCGGGGGDDGGDRSAA